MMSSFNEHIHFSRLLCDNLMLFYFWSSLMSNDFVKKVNWPLIDADAVMIKYSYLEDINMRKYKSFIILAAVFLILTSCRKDDKTEIIEEGWDNGWLYICHDGQYGWINAEYVTPTGEVEN